MISKQLLQELREIFKEDYGVRLPDEVLSEVANVLVQYYEVLLKVSDGNNEA